MPIKLSGPATSSTRPPRETSADASTRFLLDEGFGVERPADAQDVAPKWNMMFPLGVVKHRSDFPDGRIAFDAAFLGSMEANFKKMAARYKGPDTFALQVNYHHRGASEDMDVTPTDAKVASGWIEGVRLDAKGLWCLIRWTERARGYVLADELRYLSPEFAVQYRDTDTGKQQGPTLLGAALLNDPYLKELPRVAASDSQPQAQEADRSNMDRKMICAALGLAEDASDETIMSAIEGLKKNMSDAEAGATKLSALFENVKTLAAAKDEMATKLSAAEAQLTKLAAEKKETEVESFVSELVKSNRITPAQRENVKKLALVDLGAVREAFKDALPVIDMKERGVTGATEGSDEKAKAKQQFDARVDELVKLGTRYQDATKQATVELPKVAELVFA